MKSLLFEEPFQLGCVLLLILLVLAGLWFRLRTPASVRGLLAGLLLVPLLFILQQYVVTSRERLELTTRQLANRVEAGEIEAVLDLCDRSALFAYSGGFDSFEAELARLLDKYEITDAQVGGFAVEMQKEEAKLQCGASCVVTSASWTQRVPSRWELTFRLRDNEWYLTDIRPLSIAGQKDYGGLGDIP